MNNAYEEFADRIRFKTHLLLVAFIESSKVEDVHRIVSSAIVDTFKELNDRVPLAEIAIARALAERDGRTGLFKAEALHGSQANILRSNYLSDAKSIIEQVKKSLGR